MILKSKVIRILSLVILSATLNAQPPQKNELSYIIYKLANAIGLETLSIKDSSFSSIYSIFDNFNDRGEERKLVTNFKVSKNGAPEYFISKGSTSRFVSEDIDKHFVKSIQKDVFPISKFLPVTMQQLLIKSWKQNNQPKIMYSLLDSLPIKITTEGQDSVLFSAKVLILERLKIEGLVFGNEYLWIDKNNELVFVSTNDTEGDKIEIINKNYVELFVSILKIATRSAIDAVVQKYPVSKNSYPNIVIMDGTLIDVVGKDALVNNLMIVIKNGLIIYIGKKDSTKITEGALIINALGKFILPGLWDMHAHLMQPEWLPKYILQGVTTVRDCGNEFDFINLLQREVNDRKLMGPEIIKAGLIDGSSKEALGTMQAKTKKDAIALVNSYQENGFAQIKIYSNVKYPILKIICKEAHKLGMTVTGHLPYGHTATTNINAGMDMVSHVSYFQNTIKLKNKQLDFTNKKTREFIKLLQSKKIVLDPTLSVYANSGKAYLDNLPYYKIVTNQLRQLGIPIIAGTDMSPGGIATELALYVDAGFTPLQAIQSATIIPAQVMKMDKETGSIEEGKKADIILLNRNPLLNIVNIKDVKTVIKGGQFFIIE